MSFPILEFDLAHEAFIGPSKVIRARDLPEHRVITVIGPRNATFGKACSGCVRMIG